MPRYRVSATVQYEADATDETDAQDHLSAALESVMGLAFGPHIPACTIYEVRPREAPRGAERWAEGAREIAFDGYDGDDGERLYLVGPDGAWWWTNGHAMLRCEGDPPAGMGWRRLPDDAYAMATSPELARMQAKPVDLAMSGKTRIRRIGRSWIQDAYFRIAGARDVKWLAAGELDAVHAVDGHGQLIAVVMPMRADTDDVRPVTEDEAT